MGRSTWRAGGALLLFLCIAVAGTAALAQDEIVISPGPGTLQITAGDDGGTIEVAVTNTSISVDKVTFAYLNTSTDPSGALSVTSDSADPFQTTFSSTKAGDATIGITIDCHDSSASMRTSLEYPVRVKPADPNAYISYTYDQTVSVGESTDIVVRMKDTYGNVINEETNAEIDFWIGENHVRQGFDSNGNCTVTFTAPTKTGHVLIGIYPVIESKNLDRLIDIEIVSLRDPHSIEFYHIVTAPGEPYPVPLQCLAGNTYYFDVGVLVRDKYLNPITNYPMKFSTNLSAETVTITTGYDGIAHKQVGPQKSIGDVLVTTKLINESAKELLITETLTFTGGVGAGYGLSVNPADLPSYDVDPDTRAAIVARVFNSMGTGVEGELVTFDIIPDSLTSSIPMSSGPSLSAPSAETNAEGYATVYLTAGSFPTLGSIGFDPWAYGSCKVRATWEGAIQDSPVITWRNYPYLRVETSVSDSVVAPGDPVDVSIYLIGDGYDLEAGNASIVLCMDRSEQMLEDEKEGGQRDRMIAAREAAMNLVDDGESHQFLTANTNVALVTYGDPTTNPEYYPEQKANYFTIPVGTGLTYWKSVGTPGDKDEEYVRDHYPGHGNESYLKYSEVEEEFNDELTWSYLKTALDNIVPVKGEIQGEVSSPIRDGLYTSIDYLMKNSGGEDTKAVVLLMSSSYRCFGDPLARGDTELTYNESIDVNIPKNTLDYYRYGNIDQNLSAYAAQNGITIYAVYYSGTSMAQGELDTVRILTQSTGGDYYVATGYYALQEAFSQIGADIERKAGLQTSVSLSFAEVPENFTYTSTELLTYKSPTFIDFYNWSSDGYTKDDSLPDYPITDLNQTESWLGLDGTPAGSLDFEVGNVSVKQTWMTNFSFTVNASISEPLNFSLFGGNSKVTFKTDDGTELEQVLSPITITVIPGLAPQDLYNATIKVEYLDLITSDESFAYFYWPIDYNGNFPMDEQFYIRRIDGEDTSWKKIGSMTAPVTCTGDTLSLYTVDLSTGIYEARIRVSTADAGYDEKVALFQVDVLGGNFILLT